MMTDNHKSQLAVPVWTLNTQTGNTYVSQNMIDRYRRISNDESYFRPGDVNKVSTS